MPLLLDSQEIYAKVGKHYGAAARTIAGDGSYAQRVANAFGYSQSDLEGMPADANLGLSCGNPIALANLHEGEIVCDLGSGAGFDVFQAAKKVGRTGKAIGVDFNKEMLQRAEKIKTTTGIENVEFVDCPITKVSLPASSIDCVISNCVINLVPEAEKQLVFNEMFRLLKSGGRVAVSDILAKGELPEHVRTDMALYVGCIAGASPVQAYESYFRAAGFENVLLVDSKSDLNVYWQTEGGQGACCGPTPAVDSRCGASPNVTGNKKSGCGGIPSKTVSDVGKSHNAIEQGKSSCCGPAKALSEEQKVEGRSQLDYNQFAGSYKIFAIKP